MPTTSPTPARPLVVLGSSRRDGETRRAIDLAFGDEADLVDLLGYDVGVYDYDHKNRDDDFLKVVNLILPRPTIVLATPVYWYAMSATMKLFFDRLTDLITIEKPKGKALAGKSVWLIATGSEQALPDGFEVPFARTCEYFSMNYRGSCYLSTYDNPDSRTENETLFREFGHQIIRESAYEQRRTSS